MDAPTPRDTPKSRRTRARILEAALSLFVEVGYSGTTNAAIAERAKLTRGAMLYHFPTHEDMIDAAINHIEGARAKLFDAAAAPHGPDASEQAIDAYWALLHEPAFVAFSELESAARTDDMLRQRLAAAQSAFDHAQVGVRFNALARAGDDPRFQTSRDLGRFLLEGLAKGTLTYDQPERTERLLAVVKRAVHILNRKGSVQDLWEV